MKKYNLITPEGTKDVLFEECIERRNLQKKITAIFEARGYNEVITPGIEYYDVFDIENAGIPQEEMYKSTDNHGRLLVFRPDLTLPIARLAATRLHNHSLPLRLYYNQPVWRNRPDLSGRSDESTQTGIELMGAEGLRADLEVITTAAQVMKACGRDFRIEIGHAAIFRIFADKLPISEELKEEIRSIIESKNYAALSEILDNMEDTSYVKALKHLPRLFGAEEVFEEAAQYCTEPKAQEILDYLRTLYKSLEKLGLGNRIMVDLGLVQRNDYYTGVVFSAYEYGHGEAVLMGGRYDKLLSSFGAPMAACGFAVDVDALTSMAIKNRMPVLPAPEILVHGLEGYEMEAQLELMELIDEGQRAEVSVFATLEEAEKYAAEKGIKEIVVVGDEI